MTRDGDAVMARLSLRDRAAALLAKFLVLWRSFISAEQLVYFEDEAPRRGLVVQAPSHDEPPKPPPEESLAIGRCSINDGQHTYYENEIPTDRPALVTEPLFGTSTDTPAV